jgi:hypothetical protein
MAPHELVSGTMQAKRLRAATEDALLTSLQTELAVVRTMCILARREKGELRAYHLRQAEVAFALILALAERTQPDREVRADIEQARQDILMLGGRDFSESDS